MDWNQFVFYIWPDYLKMLCTETKQSAESLDTRNIHSIYIHILYDYIYIDRFMCALHRLLCLVTCSGHLTLVLGEPKRLDRNRNRQLGHLAVTFTIL